MWARLQPLRGGQLVRADDGAHVIAEHLRGGAGQAAQAGAAQGRQEAPQRPAQRARAMPDLQ